MALKATQPSVTELADICLNYLAENPEQLAEFMNISGLSSNDLRNGLGSRSLAVGLLDYVVQNEPVLLAICAANALKPETVMRVWAKLNHAE